MLVGVLLRGRRQGAARRDSARGPALTPPGHERPPRPAAGPGAGNRIAVHTMNTVRQRFHSGLRAGVAKGWSGFVWMIQILLPISFATMLFNYSGWIGKIDFLLAPAMGLLGLPAIAALPLAAGLLTGIYGGIAAMLALPLNVGQMTLVANFLLISHNLLQEGIIQHQSGFNGWKATLVRLSTSVLTVMLLARLLGVEAAAPETALGGMAAAGPFLATLKTWALATLRLSVKIFFIIMVLMIILGLMKSFDLTRHLVVLMAPALKVLGLDRRVGFLWLTATVFGLTYGAAVILEEVKEGQLDREELERLHVSIGINHSMVEDPILFLPMGLSAAWLWVPRIVAAVLAVQLLGLWQRLGRGKRLPAAGTAAK
jgi:hypothetical protein